VKTDSELPDIIVFLLLRATSFCKSGRLVGLFMMVSIPLVLWPRFIENEMKGTVNENRMEKIRKYLLKVNSFSLRRKNQYSPKKRTINISDLMMKAVISVFF
jgi:hypothetical protein